MTGKRETAGGRLQPSYLMESVPGPETVINGRRCLYFGGVSYFGLHGHPELMRAGIDAWQRLGLGSATSRAGMGTTPLYLEVEAAAAEFFGTEAAAYLASGYLSNTAGVQALHGMEMFDVAFVDEHVHYCVTDAVASTGVPVHRFAHLDADDLRRRLREHVTARQRPVVMTDGLFPVFGRIAPVPDYIDAVEPYDGLVWLDDAHPMGILGPAGRGTCDHFGVDDRRVYSGGTLSKAFGGFGGVITGPAEFVERVRGGPVMIGASAPPSPVAGATLRGIELVAAHPEWRERLWSNARFLKDGLKRIGVEVEPTHVPIAAFELESGRRMEQVHEELLRREIAIQYTHYSGVGSEGALRIVVFSTHSEDQMERLLDVLGSLL